MPKSKEHILVKFASSLVIRGRSLTMPRSCSRVLLLLSSSTAGSVVTVSVDDDGLLRGTNASAFAFMDYRFYLLRVDLWIKNVLLIIIRSSDEGNIEIMRQTRSTKISLNDYKPMKFLTIETMGFLDKFNPRTYHKRLFKC